MTKRQLKKLAQKIAELEKIIQTSNDKEQVLKAQKKITSLSMNLENEDLWCLDELIQEQLET